MRVAFGAAAFALAFAVTGRVVLGLAGQTMHGQPEIQWKHLSSATGDLPLPGESQQQTGALVADLDKDGVNDFVLSFRQRAPALVWYRRNSRGWNRYVIEKEFLTVEAGGAAYDIDGDGYPDLVFGADYQGDELWWWRNPGGHYDPNVSWERHTIKKGGAHQFHDQIFGDFEGTGKPQLVFWNQGSKTLYIAEIPPDPRHANQWPMQVVYSGTAGEGPGKYAEGLGPSISMETGESICSPATTGSSTRAAGTFVRSRSPTSVGGSQPVD